jgi:hypothetical protein
MVAQGRDAVTVAEQANYQGPHCTGPRDLIISTSDGNTITARCVIRVQNKLEALAIAKRESAIFIV